MKSLKAAMFDKGVEVKNLDSTAKKAELPEAVFAALEGRGGGGLFGEAFGKIPFS